jgi:solute carrier family 35 protein C2
MSGSEEHELGTLDSDLDLDDGETGLDRYERQKHLKRKRRHDGLDSRIAGTAGLSKDEAKEADKRVMRNLLVNAALIGGWYFFSLSISIVSLPSRDVLDAGSG